MGMDSVFRLSVVMGMVDNLTNPLSSVQDSVSNSTKSMNEAFGTVQKAGAALAGVGTAITGACLATVSSTFETQNALGELSSLGVKDLEAVEAAAKSFSDTWAGTTKSDFITASYDIKSGIASLSDEGVAKFTELAALTGKATKSSTEEMGSLFATGYGIYKGMYENLSDLEFGEVFSAGIATAVKNYKTSGSEMASAISALGATATNSNVSLEEQLAILGQLQTTMSGSEAATKYKAFLTQAAAAGKELGLTFVDSNNQLLSTPKILEKLKSKYGDTIDAVEKQELKKAFGTDEAVAMIDLLYNKTGTLKNGIEDLSGSMKKGAGVTKEMAQAIQNTPEQKFQVLKQQIHNNVEELGKSLLPVVNETMDKFSGLIQKGYEWINNNRELVSTIMNIALKLGVVLTVIGTVVAVVGTVGKAILAVKNAIMAAKAAWAVLSALFAANPIGLVVIAIVGLVAAFVVLWKKSEAFRNFWIQLFNKVKGVVLNAWNELKPALQTLGNNLINLYEASKPILEIIVAIAGAIATIVLGEIVGYIQGIVSALVPLTNALSSLVSFATNAINAIVALFRGDFSGACDFAKAAVDDLKNFFINGFDAITSFVGGFADGFLDTVGGALKAVGIDASSTISSIKSTVHNGLNGVKSLFGNVMEAAASTVKSKLSNIKAAYQSNGGGVKGAVAASMAAVKGLYTSGLTFIDNLTGGKLSAIKNKFTSGLQGAVSAVSSKMNSIKEKFREKITAAGDLIRSGIEKIKGFFNFNWQLPKLKLPHFSISGSFSLDPPSVPSFGIEWYKNGGIMTSPTMFGMNPVTGKGMVGGEAGEEAILPLSILWDKLHAFISNELGEKDTGEKKSKTLVQALSKKETITLEKRQTDSTTNNSKKEIRTDSKGTVIQKVEIKVDISKLKDLPMLFKLLDEIKDAQNSTDEPEPA